jgi:hypothetical protein
MAALGNLYFKKETLETLLKGINSKGINGISITISINDTEDNYGNNIASFVSQTKEESVAKKKRYYTGNGKINWINGEGIKVAGKGDVKSGSTPTTPKEDDEIPF